MTSTVVPRGGISKDERRPDNGAFHTLAVNLAITSTQELLEDIRAAVEQIGFLRYLVWIQKPALLSDPSVHICINCSLPSFFSQIGWDSPLLCCVLCD